MKARVKICGLKDARSLAAAVEGGAAYIGFVFFRRSPRFITADAAGVLINEIPRSVTAVGLFVNPTDAELETVLTHARLGMIQLHGNETPARVDKVRMLSGLPVIKAVGVATARDVLAAKIYEDHADWLLFDAKPPKDATRPGGNALAFDWSLLKTYAGKTPWMLAGGLTRGSVAAAIKASGARAVDVSSGVETAPGVKSPAKIRAFLKTTLAAASRK
ncbi:MAG: phosphoribosylanthranilate isomerase [Proteobacteria bacterium]|nr:phosphoribosylanthranilate isomerase [Pseudomonadota bacterium]